jgi:hypothetical protein
MNQVFTGILAGISLAISLPALAEHGERHHEGREVQNFRGHDRNVWEGGRWYHGRHEGQRGWWWIAGGMWYYYPTPVYPYPDPYAPPASVITQTQPLVVMQQPPAPPPPQSPPAALFWHYCDSANGYFPAVPNCPEGWRSVPTQAVQITPY